MIDEGIVRSVPRPEGQRRGRFVLVFLAPVAAVAAAWGVDEALSALRSVAAGAGYWPQWPVPPIVGVHHSLAGWLVAATLAVSGTWLASNRRPVGLAVAIGLTLPLGFGTVRDEIRWARAPRVARALAFSPVCVARDAEASDVEWDGRRWRRDGAEPLAVTGASARWEEEPLPSVVLRVDSSLERALAEHSWTQAKKAARGMGCGFDAFVVDGQVRFVSRVDLVFLWGSLAIRDRDPGAMRRLFALLTGASEAGASPTEAGK